MPDLFERFLVLSCFIYNLKIFTFSVHFFLYVQCSPYKCNYILSNFFSWWVSYVFISPLIVNEDLTIFMSMANMFMKKKIIFMPATFVCTFYFTIRSFYKEFLVLLYSKFYIMNVINIFVGFDLLPLENVSKVKHMYSIVV